MEITNGQFAGGTIAGAYSVASAMPIAIPLLSTTLSRLPASTKVYGGYAAAGTANDNSVTITGTRVLGRYDQPEDTVKSSAARITLSSSAIAVLSLMFTAAMREITMLPAIP